MKRTPLPPGTLKLDFGPPKGFVKAVVVAPPTSTALPVTPKENPFWTACEQKDTEGPLFWSGESSAINPEILQKYNIKHVVRILPHPHKYPDGISVFHIPIEDSVFGDAEEILASHIPALISFIHNARMSNNPVLVHCQAGISRSTSVVIVYMLLKGYAENINSCIEALCRAKGCMPDDPTGVEPKFDIQTLLKSFSQNPRNDDTTSSPRLTL